MEADAGEVTIVFLSDLHNQIYGANNDMLLRTVADVKPDVILIGTGSEVELCMNAAEELKKDGVSARVVSMPCMDLFEEQDAAYKESVLPGAVRARVAVEAGTSFGWAKYVGLDGGYVTIDHFGASAPAGVLFEKFGFTTQAVVDKAKEVLGK